jgi:hypothetical protein
MLPEQDRRHRAVTLLFTVEDQYPVVESFLEAYEESAFGSIMRRRYHYEIMLRIEAFCRRHMTYYGRPVCRAMGILNRYVLTRLTE